jgi:hypothetical protein
MIQNWSNLENYTNHEKLMGRFANDIVLTGKSGEIYPFEVWEISSTLAPVEAVYIVAKKEYTISG